MTDQAALDIAAAAPLREARQLRATLALLSALAGTPAPESAGEDDAGRYERLSTLARRRHDALAAEATLMATNGLAALIGCTPGAGRTTAARLLVARLGRSLAEMERVLAG